MLVDENKLILLILAFFMNASGFSQNRPAVSVSPTKMNILYCGVNNPIEIAVSGIASDDVYPASDSTCEISSIGYGKYIIKPLKPGMINNQVFAYGELVENKAFRVLQVPDPIPLVAMKNGGTIRKEVLSAQRYVFTRFNDFNFEINPTITEFTVSATINDEKREAKSNSNKLTPEQTDIINSVPKGEKVYFDGIVVQMPRDKRKLPDMEFILK